jgi:hypothetical protein
MSTKAPKGRDLLALLIQLYADQENLVVEYELENPDDRLVEIST